MIMVNCELCGHLMPITKRTFNRIRKNNEAVICWSCAREVANTLGRPVVLQRCKDDIAEYRNIIKMREDENRHDRL